MLPVLAALVYEEDAEEVETAAGAEKMRTVRREGRCAFLSGVGPIRVRRGEVVVRGGGGRGERRRSAAKSGGRTGGFDQGAIGLRSNRLALVSTLELARPGRHLD